MLKKFLNLLFSALIIIFSVINFASCETLSTGPHWQKNYFTVYVQPGKQYSNLMNQAFSTWQSKSYGKLYFLFRYQQPADIEVTFSSDKQWTDTPISSYDLNIYNGNTIANAHLYISDNIPKDYSNKYINAVMLHSIGHCLGLSDTNRLASGIMYSPVNESLVVTKSDIRKLFSINNWSWKDKNFK